MFCATGNIGIKCVDDNGFCPALSGFWQGILMQYAQKALRQNWQMQVSPAG